MSNRRPCVLAIDQGTTGTTVLLIDRAGKVLGRGYAPITQHYPRPGWVEHDPDEIWASVVRAAADALAAASALPDDVAAVGITNQRETTVVWERATGRPMGPAVVWQCRRSAGICDELRARGLEPEVRRRTGLVIDAYFSASKLIWLFRERPELRAQAERGELAFGTVDSWLIWQLTGGRHHVTEPSNASRTMLFDLGRLDWDDELLREFGLPRALLPEVVPTLGRFGHAQPLTHYATPILRGGTPIAGVAGDQQAALFGQLCFEPGDVKVTYGTGAFLLMQTGPVPRASANGLLTTVAWQLSDRVDYALEGSVFVAGAAVQWLRDELRLIESAAETEVLAESLPDNGGVYLVPAFVGLGAPYWDQAARGVLVGLTRGSGRAHLARAALEAIAFQVDDVLRAMAADAGLEGRELRIDGGAAANAFLARFQAELSGLPVVRPRNLETTAAGAAYLAGLGVGLWPNRDALRSVAAVERRFDPLPGEEVERRRGRLRAEWQRAVERARRWALA